MLGAKPSAMRAAAAVGFVRYRAALFDRITTLYPDALRAVSLLRPAGMIWASSMLAAAAGMLAQMAIAPWFGPHDFGVFAASLATAGIAASIVPLGVAPYLLKAFGREGAGAMRWVRPSFGLTALSCTAVGASTLVFVRVGDAEGERTFLLLCLLPFVIFAATGELARAAYQIQGRFNALAGLQAAPGLLRLLLALGIVAAGAGLPALGIGYAVVFLILIGISGHAVICFWRSPSTLATHTTPAPEERANIWTLLRLSWPFGLHTGVYMVYYYIDVVLVDRLAGPTASGQYYIAFTFLNAAFLIPGTVFHKLLLARIHGWAEHAPERLAEVYRLGLRAMFPLGVVAAASLIACGLWLVPLLFGAAYVQAGQVLAVLAFAAPAHFCTGCLSSLLLTRDNIRRKLAIDGGCLVFNVAANLLLIPAYGVYGAATALISTEVLLLLLYWQSTVKHVLPLARGRR